MDQEKANALFHKGAFLLFFDAPPRLEFGIDCQSWTVGPKFKGMKLVPPGLHFVYWSATSKEGVSGMRFGFFKFFESGEIMVRGWDAETENFVPKALSPEDLARYRANLEQLDPFLGAYPLNPPTLYQQWCQLTNYITPRLLARVLPHDGLLGVQDGERTGRVEEVRREDRSDREVREALDKEEGVEFTTIDLRRSYPPGATGTEVTRWSVDKSWLLEDVIRREYNGDYRELLGELQLGFVCLLIGQNFSGLSQWKLLVQLVCQSQEAIARYGSTLYIEFLEILKQQLTQCPEDFFSDILSENNFLLSMLKKLARNLPGDGSLHAKFTSFQGFLRQRFRWDLAEEVAAEREAEEHEEEEGEYAPVVVEL
ncbi:uncharacterized protein VTP21DRAFT_8800 [Calcarisporiella thermophila]|uniref:uncharacterized protein n=1 Tax=Calcarisporiella thermophila TaxID=911321 RepID=UPI003741F683